MTNKEKLQEIFPNMIFTGTIMMYEPTEQVLASRINYSWLNAKYEEPKHIADVSKKVEPITNSNIPFLMHKEMDIPISECQKAYDIALEYLRNQVKVKG